MKKQRTLKNEIDFQGIGLHTGRPCKVTLRPAPSDSGVVFFRTDRGVMISLDPLAVVDTAFATTIGYNGTRIKTIEHLMAVLSAFEIDNIIIEVEGPEIPALDGSSTDIAGILLQAGIQQQQAPKKFIEIIHPVTVSEGQAKVTALPYHGRKFSQVIEFHNSQFFHKQELTVDLTPEVFIRDVAPARTFGFLKDVEMLRQNGLAKGGSLDNAVVVDGDTILNPSGLRFADEFVRHKILDCIGDLYIIGVQIYGHIIAERSGHSTNIKFIKQLLSHPESYRLTYFDTAPDFQPATLRISS